MKLLSVLSVITFLFALAAGSPIANIDDHIYSVGSDQCAVGQFPHLVSIKVDNLHVCGGWIYNERFIVTSAECVIGYSAASVVVTVGENQLNLEGDNKINYIIQNIYFYTLDGGYNPETGLHNIALLQTVLSIDLEGNPLADFLYYDEHEPLQPATIAGWGETALGGGPALRCRTVNITIANDNQCFAGFGGLYNPVYQLCSSIVATANACDGDEGGPVMQQIGNDFVIVGMITKVVQGCAANTSVGMAKISAYYSWLTQTAGRQPIRPVEPPQPKIQN